MLSSYFDILKKKDFSLLWIGQIISQFGDRLTQMALIGLVYEITPYSSLGLAKIMSIPIIAVFIVSPIAGVYVDRWDRRKTMYVSDFLRGICIISIPLIILKTKTLFFIYFLIFFSFCVGRFFIPAKMSIIPYLVNKESIVLANSLVSITAMIAAILGFGLGGIIVERLGTKVAFFIDGITFFLSSFFIFLMKIKSKKYVFDPHDLIELGKKAFEKVRKSFMFEFKEGIKYLWRTKQTRYAAKVFFLLFSCLGSLYVVFIIFIQKTLSSVTLDLGYLAVALGSGLFLGSLIYGRVGKNFSFKKGIDFSLLGIGGYLTFFVIFLRNHPNKVFAFVSCFILGMLASPIVIGVNSLIHKESQDAFWGRVFSSLEIIIHLAFIVFMFISSWLAEIVGPFTIIISVGIIMFLFSIFNLLADKRRINL